MASNDPRRNIRRRFFAKAHHVTALAECARRYGSRSRSKEVAGTVLECLGKKTKTNRSSTYVKAVYALGGGTLKTVELNIRSVLKAPNNPQYFVPEILHEPGEPLGPPIKPMPALPLPEDTDNADGNSVVDLRQPIPIVDAIDTIDVPEILHAVVLLLQTLHQALLHALFQAHKLRQYHLQ